MHTLVANHDIFIKELNFPFFQCLSVPFINKDASSNSSFRKMSVKYLCSPHKVIPS